MKNESFDDGNGGCESENACRESEHGDPETDGDSGHESVTCRGDRGDDRVTSGMTRHCHPSKVSENGVEICWA